MAYWLMKSEPSAYSITDLEQDQETYWDGIRNYQARNHMRTMQLGDEAFFYHSNCSPPGIVGVLKIVKTAYTDHTAFDPEDIHYDTKSRSDCPRWEMVDVQFVSAFNDILSLARLRAEPSLQEMLILRRGNRLSITPVTAKEWQNIIRLAG